jgi:cholesterol transport system auxiliary component
MRAVRVLSLVAAAAAMSGCFGGSRVPDQLLTLTPEAAAPAQIARSAAAGEAITIEVPLIPQELNQVRVPAHEGLNGVTYIQDLQWVDRPNRMFQQLLAETVRRTTSRVVLDPRQASLDPGLTVTGTLQRMGYDTASGQVVVVYDAVLSREGGTRVESRRFEASAPAAGTAATVGPALNRAANAVARQVAGWVGG